MQTGMITTTTTPTTTSGTTTPSNTLGKDAFMKLLVAQLKNQDPTSSSQQDPNQMVQQMTQYSQLEQAQQSNTLLTGLQTQTSGLFQAQTAALVGKNVKVSGAAFNLTSGSSAMNLDLAAQANVTLVVKDANGSLVTVLPQGVMNRGANTVTWNGRDANGNLMPNGTYKVEVSAVDANGTAVTNTPSQTMKVDAVTFKNGGIYLASGSSSFSLADVLEITA
jgi:flagellar basal-body rod modification protein FlgD